MKTNYRRICAVLAWATLIGQYICVILEGGYGGFLISTLAFFGYLTIWCNILVALAFSVPFFKPASKLRAFFERPVVRAAIALYILVVAVVYYALLFANHKPQGIQAVLNAGLHFFLPILYLIDWAFLAKKDELHYKSLPYWTILPLTYGAFNIIRGAATGYYPYPFIDVSTRGMANVGIAMLAFAIIYIIGGAGFIAVGKRVRR